MHWPFVARRERLRREASDWIARLNGAHGQTDREAFEQWYHADPDHAAAYDRLSALFSAAAHMRPMPGVSAARTPAVRGRQGGRPRFALATLVAAAIVVILGYTALRERETRPSTSGDVQVAVFRATREESRQVFLIEGSEVLLSPGSELDVNIDGKGRRLRLRRGEARFTVSHEARPFVVTAVGTEVVARGTQFIVSLTPDNTLVSLIEGRIEVFYASTKDGGKRRLASLGPGQRLSVPVTAPPPSGAATTTTGAARPAMIEFDNTPLAAAVDAVNRRADRKVVLADPKLADLRVTGAFPAGDGEGFARSVAAALGLTVRSGDDGPVWLMRSGSHRR